MDASFRKMDIDAEPIITRQKMLSARTIVNVFIAIFGFIIITSILFGIIYGFFLLIEKNAKY